ncbi:MAG: bactofilin family protein [bacterium]
MKREKNTESAKINTILGTGTTFEGVLSFEGNIRIQGEFRGEINTDDTLTIGETGDVTAKVRAGNIIVMGGKLTGNIEAKNKIEMLAGARVYGNIKTPRLIINDGVLFNGRCQMGDEEEFFELDENVLLSPELRTIEPPPNSKSEGEIKETPQVEA